MKYKILATGSNGNCTVIENKIAIDMGVTYKAILPFVKELKLVCLTHIHSDHLNKTTIKKLAKERPMLRFACGEFLKEELELLGVKNIDIMKVGKKYDYGVFKVAPVGLYHDVENYGWRLYLGDEKAIYCTDTKSLDGIVAKDYDLYLIEANYCEEGLKKRIEEKQKSGEYIYEYYVPERHLSKQQADNFICENIGVKGVFVYMHQHIERGVIDV